MADIVIYATPTCPYCRMAKLLLEEKGAVYQEIRVDRHPQLRQEMIQRSKRYTVPQIFINERHVGGCDELYALDRSGTLDPMLQSN